MKGNTKRMDTRLYDFQLVLRQEILFITSCLLCPKEYNLNTILKKTIIKIKIRKLFYEK